MGVRSHKESMSILKLTEVEARKSGEETEGVGDRARQLRSLKLQTQKTGEEAEGLWDRALDRSGG